MDKTLSIEKYLKLLKIMKTMSFYFLQYKSHLHNSNHKECPSAGHSKTVNIVVDK